MMQLSVDVWVENVTLLICDPENCFYEMTCSILILK